MSISIIVKAFLGCLVAAYLLFSGWMILKNKKVYLPLNIKFGLWLSSKIYGDDFAEQERVKFIKNQLSQGKLMIIIGLIVLFLSLFPLFNL